MPKLNQRSIGTQSDLQVGATDPGRKLYEIGAKCSILCKKSAYRNLLQKSITVDANGRTGLVVASSISNAGQSIGTQTDNSKRDKSLEETISAQWRAHDLNLSRSFYSEDEVVVPYEDDAPCTSRVVAQKHSASFDNREGSLAVIYSGENCRQSFGSRISELPCIYQSQTPPRRQSDEAVLLIQDYQSYDVLNAVRRQDTNAPTRENRRKYFYPKRKRQKKRDGMNRPMSIIPDGSVATILTCRICHEGEEVEPLIRPCLCKGSVGYIHAKCLKIWLEQSNTSRCEICGYSYAIRQTKRYSRFVSIFVFLRSIVDRRALMYDIVSFVAVTPLCIAGIVMCIRASIISTPSFTAPGTNFQMGNVTRAGMIMLSTTIIIAYTVWLYTLASYHYKMWKRWYNSCYDVEVIPVFMTSEERLEIQRRIDEENKRRNVRMDRRLSGMTVLQPGTAYQPITSFYHRRPLVDGRVQSLPQ